ncbi:hypothetical protein KC622_00360 [Candidatus Dojkabacteria bacterium]|uniref:Uncharacterized protein n=1 Tax=Candidatus Dojkabacteria bacterium TaxID=2099670 RepID=A0A955KV53_9BACT|nr:hypothetical protein [Candidatus Dojkabacteria bacterium]MCB9790927.1 hypothetical protein [Candidatus Nomurabacteria bacterium]
MENQKPLHEKTWLIVVLASLAVISTSISVWMAWQAGYLNNSVSESTESNSETATQTESNSVAETEDTTVGSVDAIKVNSENEYDIRLTSDVYGTKYQVILTSDQELVANYDAINTIFPNVTVDAGDWEMDMVLLSEAYPQSITDDVELAFNHSQAGDVYRVVSHDSQTTMYTYMNVDYSPDERCLALGELLDAPCGTEVLDAGDVALRIVCRANSDNISMCESVLENAVFKDLTEAN